MLQSFVSSFVRSFVVDGDGDDDDDDVRDTELATCW